MKMDSKYSPIGICKRLINFISSKIFRQSSRDPEITVEFRHVGDHSEKGSEEKEIHQQIPIRDSDRQKINGTAAIGKGQAHEDDRAVKRSKKSVTIKEDEKMIRKRDRADGEKDHAHDEAKPRPPRHWGPLLSVASNINEKCEAFINSRKRAMRRNYTLDPDQKS